MEISNACQGALCLGLGGFLAQRGELHLPTVIAVGVLAATVGDNTGCWLGRRFGREIPAH
jgi:membrane protein DedA with SNARE-associated domain